MKEKFIHTKIVPHSVYFCEVCWSFWKIKMAARIWRTKFPKVIGFTRNSLLGGYFDRRLQIYNPITKIQNGGSNMADEIF